MPHLDKTLETQVPEGSKVKTAACALKMSVPSLGYLCRQVAKENIDLLEYVSTLPYTKVEDLLVLVKTAQQLAEIELCSPQIVDEDDRLWEAFVRKEFRVRHKRNEKQYKAVHGPDSVLPVCSWRDLHNRYKQEEAEIEAQSLQMLSASMAQHDQAKFDQQTSLLDPRKLPRLPGTAPRSSSTFPRGGFAPGPKNFLQKARREAFEDARRRRVAAASTNLAIAGSLPLRKLKTAPKGFKEQVRIRMQPKFVPRPPKQQPLPQDEERARREAKLLAAKKPAVSGIQKPSDSPTKPVGLIKPAPSTTPKKAADPKVKDATSLLFPNAGSPAKIPPKVVIKTVTVPSKSANGPKAKPTPSQKSLRASSSSQPTAASPPALVQSSPGRDRARPRAQAASPMRPREGCPAVSYAASPTKRPVVPSRGSAGVATVGGARNCLPSRPRKRRKEEDLVFRKPTRNGNNV